MHSITRRLLTRPTTSPLSHARLYSSSNMPDQSQSKWSHLPLSTKGPVDCAVSGTVLLNTPYFNHGSAHTQQERRDFNLTGLLPAGIQSLEQQAKRAYEQYSSRKDDLAKNTFLTSMKEQNLVLYYKVCLAKAAPAKPVRILTMTSFCKTTWMRCSALYIRRRKETPLRTSPACSGGRRGAS